jgi:hypothetical protein
MENFPAATQSVRDQLRSVTSRLQIAYKRQLKRPFGTPCRDSYSLFKGHRKHTFELNSLSRGILGLTAGVVSQGRMSQVSEAFLRD